MKLDLEAYCVYFQVCVKMAPAGQIVGPLLAPNNAKIRPKGIFRLFCKGFHWIQMKNVF